jgi:hypothetical protein
MLKKNKFEIGVVLLFGAIYCIYCSYVMLELPFLTWFDQLPLIDKLYTKELSLSDLMNTYGEHGMFGTNLLFLLNCGVFNMSTLFDVYLNDINVIIVAGICIYGFYKSCPEQQTSYIYRICLIVISFFAFNIMQGSSGGMETQVRLGLLFCIIAMYMCDRILLEKTSPVYVIVTVLMIFFSMNVFGTLYSFAMLTIICLVNACKCVRYKSLKRREGVIVISCMCCGILYLVQYQLIGKGGMTSGGIAEATIFFLKNPISIWKGLVGYCGSFLLGYRALADGEISSELYLLIGTIVMLIVIYAIWRFFVEKQYRNSWFPIYLIFYSFFVWGMVLIGRYGNGSGGWQWFTNDWYYVHTKIAVIGVIWILAHSFYAHKHILKQVALLALCFTLVGGVYGSVIQVKVAPSIKNYYKEKQPYLFAEDISELSVDENGNTPLLHTREVTMQSIEILKKYSLSVYRYYDAYLQMQVGNTLSTCRIVKGISDDGWVESSANLIILSGDQGIIHLEGRYTESITGDEVISISCNGDSLIEYALNSESFAFDIPCSVNSQIELTIQTNFSFQSLPDIRELAFILSDLNAF